METILAKSIIVSVLTLITIISGILLRKAGKPYKAGIFLAHKLAVAGTVVFVILIYNQHFHLLSFQGTGLVLFVISSLIFLVSFITGAFLSFEKFATFKMQITHRILSWLTILFIPIIWVVCH